MKAFVFGAFLVFLAVLVCLDVTSAGGGHHDKDSTSTTNDKSPRSFNQSFRPSDKIKRYVEKYKEFDDAATFTFFNGHVDSFTTSSKLEIPDYAIDVLRQYNLPDKVFTPRKMDAPTFSDKVKKHGNDLDGDDWDIHLPYVMENEVKEQSLDNSADKEDESSTTDPPVQYENRSQPNTNPHMMLDWDRPSDEDLKVERQASHLILQNFIQKFGSLFEIKDGQFNDAMKFKSYHRGAFVRRVEYTQSLANKEQILYGKTLALLDVNWNVVSISRMIVTPEKIELVKPARDKCSGRCRIHCEKLKNKCTWQYEEEKCISKKMGKEPAIKKAISAMPRDKHNECNLKRVKTIQAELMVDIIRKEKVWSVEMATKDGNCHWHTVLSSKYEVLNVSDLIGHYNDAKVNRWYFSGGDLLNPAQIVSSNQYTRNDRRLEHDFFYVMNDHRCEGNPETACGELAGTDQCEDAYGSKNGPSEIRATRRTARDFDQYYPSGASETFAETHTYYWSRWFSQWLKPSLDALGVLPSSSANYIRCLIITNNCRDGSVHNSALSVTTDDNKGENGSVIRLAHRGGISNHNSACQSGNCVDNPSNIHHELNHFFMKQYYDIGSGLDCDSSNQLKFTHEGILGTVIMQAYWHNYYNVGYDPVSTNNLYFSHSSIGRVHTSDSTLMKLSDYWCVDYTEDPYRAGRVLGQALWKFYHGKKVSGSTTSGTWYPSTDTDFLILSYWAADLQSASTYKDRYEYANRFMEILEFHSNWSSAGKSDYCDIFAQHDADNYITSSYCS